MEKTRERGAANLILSYINNEIILCLFWSELQRIFQRIDRRTDIFWRITFRRHVFREMDTRWVEQQCQLSVQQNFKNPTFNKKRNVLLIQITPFSNVWEVVPRLFCVGEVGKTIRWNDPIVKNESITKGYLIILQGRSINKYFKGQKHWRSSNPTRCYYCKQNVFFLTHNLIHDQTLAVTEYM